MSTPDQSPLGKPSAYPDQYDPTLLFPIARATNRAAIGLTARLPFIGADLWTAFELSWLNTKGKPQVALAHITVPAESTHIVESKSFKLYLNSFNNTRIDDASEVRDRIARDISQAVWHGGPVQASVGVKLLMPEDFDKEPVHELDGLNLDRMDLFIPSDWGRVQTKDVSPVEVGGNKVFILYDSTTGSPSSYQWFGFYVDENYICRNPGQSGYLKNLTAPSY